MAYVITINLPVFDTPFEPSEGLDPILYHYHARKAAPIKNPEFIPRVSEWNTFSDKEFKSDIYNEKLSDWLASDQWKYRTNKDIPALSLRTPYSPQPNYYQTIRALSLKEALLNRDSSAIIQWVASTFNIDIALDQLSQHTLVDLLIFTANLQLSNNLISSGYLEQFLSPEEISRITTITRDYNAFIYDNLAQIKEIVRENEVRWVLSQPTWYHNYPIKQETLDNLNASTLYGSKFEKFIHESPLVHYLEELISQEQHTATLLASYMSPPLPPEGDSIKALKLALFPYNPLFQISAWRNHHLLIQTSGSGFNHHFERLAKTAKTSID